MWGLLRQAVLLLHLAIVAIFLTLTSIVSTVILGFYRIFPFKRVLDGVYRSRRAQGLRNLFSFHLTAAARKPDVVSMAASAGYHAQQHQVTTADGFILCLHRIVAEGAEPSSRRASDAAAGPTPGGRKPVVLMVHGLMQNAEAFVVGGRGHAMAFHLVDAGFDVWLGNNRGNRYSSKHLRLKPDDDAYWDFSLDDLARFDVPAMVRYVTSSSGNDKLSYVGFSQGTAQCFASLASQPEVSSHISAFVALSPAVTVRGLSQSFMTSLVEANHEFLFLLFGKKAMLPSALTWGDILAARTFVRIIDKCLVFLFGWETKQITDNRKPDLYHCLYSYSSTKSVRHWFQLMKTGRFEMYNDDPSPSQHRIPPVYDVSTITTPMALFIGGRDGVINPTRLLELLPTCDVHHEPEYEHLDMLWADSAPQSVFPAVSQFLDKHTAV